MAWMNKNKNPLTLFFNLILQCEMMKSTERHHECFETKGKKSEIKKTKPNNEVT